MRASVLVAVALFTAVTARAGETFQRNCTVFADPDAIATRLCRKRAGDPILEAKASRNGFVRVDTGDCFGYVRESCVGELSKREPASSDRGEGANRVHLGFAVQGDGLFGKVSGVTTSTDGLGFAGALLLQVPLSRGFRVTFKPVYQYLSLTRKLTLSSVLVEPTELRFTQKIPFIGAGILASIRIAGAGQGMTEHDWCLDFGADFLTPLSGRQSDSSGDSFGFKPTTKLVLGLLGVSTRIPLSPRVDMGGYLHGYYNVAAKGGSSFYGVRLALSLLFHL